MQIFKSRDVKTPTRGTSKSAGIDFFVPNDFMPVNLYPGQSALIPSGIYAKVPNGKALVFMEKSGVATKMNLQVGAKVVDEDYQGEMHLHLTNIGSTTVTIQPGQKIVQALLLDVSYELVQETGSIEELYAQEVTERAQGGFGSTGDY
jgi:dUTP pyrophosphatase